MSSNMEKLKIRFREHRHRALSSKIGFELTFEQWLDIWLSSGQIHNRGTRKGQYVMARNGDAGPYKVGNVRIITASANGAEKRHSEKHKRYMRRIMKGNSHALGTKLSKETRVKMSQSRQGRKFSEKTRKKIAVALKGNKNSLGHRHSLESRKKMSVAISAARLRERFAREAGP